MGGSLALDCCVVSIGLYSDKRGTAARETCVIEYAFSGTHEKLYLFYIVGRLFGSQRCAVCPLSAVPAGTGRNERESERMRKRAAHIEVGNKRERESVLRRIVVGGLWCAFHHTLLADTNNLGIIAKRKEAPHVHACRQASSRKQTMRYISGVSYVWMSTGKIDLHNRRVSSVFVALFTRRVSSARACSHNSHEYIYLNHPPSITPVPPNTNIHSLYNLYNPAGWLGLRNHRACLSVSVVCVSVWSAQLNTP